MQAFTTITAKAAPLPLINIDTDMIIPKQFLKTIRRTGLGSALFHEMRYDLKGEKVVDFVLNRHEYQGTGILITGENFGCGSSREHAPWALLDFGISAIIAPSYADIFYGNCFKNGILPVLLPQEAVSQLTEHAKNPDNLITVDLQTQEVSAGNMKFTFSVDEYKRHCLLNGLDDIGITLQKEKEITAFEARQKVELPWLYANYGGAAA